MTRDYYSQFAGYPEGEWRSIHVAALVSLTFSFLCSTVIIILSLREVNYLKKKNAKISIVRLFPLALCISDIIIAIFHGGDHLYSLLNEHVAEDGLCILFAVGETGGVAGSMAWVIVMTIFLYTAVCHSLPNFGRYYWKLNTTVVLVILIFMFFPFVIDGYGNSEKVTKYLTG
eukprot:Awhi_evm1s2223